LRMYNWVLALLSKSALFMLMRLKRNYKLKIEPDKRNNWV
jgi:hypothetical protein